ncbi:OmpA family protein [uncultured Bacteroides sp.]|uniref:OmpA family protein n=1 Tax=uncultured Bacteroides sp. TaxID=162156 RepID=UPI0025F23CE1|nr:OmpA family protein [uncultured Bacteroides sp.]
MKLKRNLLLLVLGCSTLVALGQTTSSRQVYEDEETVFIPHWYMQVQAGAAQTVGETGLEKLISPAAALSAGYKFTSLWGIRAGISGWQAKGTWAVLPDAYKFNFLQGNVDATLDLSNLFCRYNSKRFFNAYMFLGMGLNGAFNNDDAIALDDAGYRGEYLWKGKKVFFAGRGGVGANMRLSNCVYFNLEMNANILSDKFNSKKADNPDWQFNVLAGLTFKFGKSNKKAKVVPYETAPLPVEVVREVKEEAIAPVEEKKIEVREEIKSWTGNIFFKINSAVIRPSEENKLLNLIAFLKKNTEVKVAVCGYADKATGTAAINMRLSKERAQAVAKVLKSNGIAPDRIILDYKGDTVQPFSVIEENRVAICVTDKIN